jgi:hypothetical protein
MLSKLRHFYALKSSLSNTGRRYHLRKEQAHQSSGGAYFDQYAAHSPLNISRHKVEEMRSKLFFETPPIPNRMPKFFLLFAVVAIFTTGVRDRILRRQKMFVREQERKMFRFILPFLQAMEDVRFTALEQKFYMEAKAIADMKNPAIWEKIRWRYHQEDI